MEESNGRREGEGEGSDGQEVAEMGTCMAS